MKTTQLSKAQQKLLEEMKGGAVCYYARGSSWKELPYYYRDYGTEKCTAVVTALLRKGLVQRVEYKCTYDGIDCGTNHKLVYSNTLKN